MAGAGKPDLTVYVIEDDEAIRVSVKAMLEAMGQSVRVYPEAKSFLKEYEAAPGRMKGCIVLDVRMPGMSGIDLQRHLNDMRSLLPIVFVTGHGDIPMAVEAVERGAVGFLTKPYRDQDLLDKVNQALALYDKRSSRLEGIREFEEALASLTPREREILERIINGQASKVIAIELDISERTVEVHRGNLFKKLKTHSLPEVTRKYLAVTGDA